MTAPLRALASAITTCLDAAKRALASANTADQQAKAASKSALDAQALTDTARVHSTNAASADAQAQASRASIDNRIYPGLFAADPVTRPDGTAIQDGDVCSLVSGLMRVRIGGVWQDWTAASGAAAAAAAAAASGSATLAQAWAVSLASPDGTASKSANSYAVDAKASRDAIDSRIYPGTFAAPPATRPDGSARQEGDQYQNTAGVSFKFTAGGWVGTDLTPLDLAGAGGAGLIGYLRTGLNAALRTLQSLFRERVSVLDTIGVTGVEANDQGAAINRAIADAASRGYCDLRFPDGVYSTSVPIVQLPGVTFKFAKNATVKAIAAMAALIQTPADQPLFRVGIYGGYIDCNDLAQVGLDAQWFQGYKVRDVEVQNYLSVGARFGLAGTAFSSYEAMVDNLRTFRGAGVVQAGAIGLHVRTATDGQYSHCVLNGAETGVLVSAGTGGRFHNIHAWTKQETGRLKYAFDDQSGGCLWEECIADTPNIAGWRLSFGNSVVLGGHAFMNSLGGVDNVADAVLITSTVPNVAVIGLTCNSVGATFRWRSNINYAAVTSPQNLHLRGNVCNNVVTPAPELIGTSVPIEVCFPLGSTVGHRYKFSNVRRWEDRFDAAANRSMIRYDATGTQLGVPFSINVATGQVSMTDAGLTLSGSFDKPLSLSSGNLWYDATGVLPRFKSGAASSTTDGLPLALKKITGTTSATIGTAVTVAHGLGYTPLQVQPTSRGPGNVYESAAADATNVTLKGTAASLNFDVYLG